MLAFEAVWNEVAETPSKLVGFEKEMAYMVIIE